MKYIERFAVAAAVVLVISTAFLAKPFAPDVLLDRIRSLTEPAATS